LFEGKGVKLTDSKTLARILQVLLIVFITTNGILRMHDPIRFRIGYSISATIIEIFNNIFFNFGALMTNEVVIDFFKNYAIDTFPEMERLEISSYFSAARFIYMPFMIIFFALTASIPGFAIVFPNNANEIFISYSVLISISSVFGLLFMIKTYTKMLKELSKYLTPIILETKPEFYMKIQKLHSKFSFAYKLYTYLIIPVGLVVMLPAFWPYLLRKGSYLVPIGNIVMLSFGISGDLFVILTQRTIQKDVIFVAKVIGSSVKLPPPSSKIRFSQKLHPVNDLISSELENIPKLLLYSRDGETPEVQGKNERCNFNIVESPKVMFVNPKRMNTAKSIPCKVADSSDFGDIDAWYEATGISVMAFDKIDEENVE
jgi:hypothetical protein